METRVLIQSGQKPYAANPPPQWCSKWNLIRICRLVSEIFMLKSVYARTDGHTGCRLESHTVSSPWAFGSGELKSHGKIVLSSHSCHFVKKYFSELNSLMNMFNVSTLRRHCSIKSCGRSWSARVCTIIAYYLYEKPFRITKGNNSNRIGPWPFLFYFKYLSCRYKYVCKVWWNSNNDSKILRKKKVTDECACHLELQREITQIDLASVPYFFMKSICHRDMYMFARFDEIPTMTLQDIKETKRYRRTHRQHENSIPPHKHSLPGYTKTTILRFWNCKII